MEHMDVEEQLAAAAQLPLKQEVVILRQFVRAQAKIITELVQTVEALKHEVGQLKRQLYGRKSEKRIKDASAPVEALPVQKERGKAVTKRDLGHVTEKGLRFRASAQVITIEVPLPAGAS